MPTNPGVTSSGWRTPAPPAPPAPTYRGSPVASFKPFAMIKITHCDDKDIEGRIAEILPVKGKPAQRCVRYLTNVGSNGKVGKVRWNSVGKLTAKHAYGELVARGTTYTLTAA